MENAKEKIVGVAIKPIVDRISHQAYEQVVESICLRDCGHTPHHLCNRAKKLHRRLFALLFQEYSRLN